MGRNNTLTGTCPVGSSPTTMPSGLPIPLMNGGSRRTTHSIGTSCTAKGMHKWDSEGGCALRTYPLLLMDLLYLFQGSMCHMPAPIHTPIRALRHCASCTRQQADSDLHKFGRPDQAKSEWEKEGINGIQCGWECQPSLYYSVYLAPFAYGPISILCHLLPLFLYFPVFLRPKESPATSWQFLPFYIYFFSSPHHVCHFYIIFTVINWWKFLCTGKKCL
jgi:hypothetical protein